MKYFAVPVALKDHTDIPTDCDFLLDYQEEGDDNEPAPTKGLQKKKPWRYRWPDAVRDEVLACKVLTGIVLERDDVRVNIRDVNGQTITVPTADIDEEAEGRSLMPQGLTVFLTRAELVDLAKFVSELGKPGPYASTVDAIEGLKNPKSDVLPIVKYLGERGKILGYTTSRIEPVVRGAVYGRSITMDLPNEGGRNQTNFYFYRGKLYQQSVTILPENGDYNSPLGSRFVESLMFNLTRMEEETGGTPPNIQGCGPEIPPFVINRGQ